VVGIMCQGGPMYWPSHWRLRHAVKKGIGVQEFHGLSERERAAVREEEAFVKSQAGGSFRTITRPTWDQQTECARLYAHPP